MPGTGPNNEHAAQAPLRVDHIPRESPSRPHPEGGGHRLRRLQPLASVARQLQLLVRTRDDHLAAKVAAANQLATLLDAA
jgi:hypothetical protein